MAWTHEWTGIVLLLFFGTVQPWCEVGNAALCWVDEACIQGTLPHRFDAGPRVIHCCLVPEKLCGAQSDRDARTWDQVHRILYYTEHFEARWQPLRCFRMERTGRSPILRVCVHLVTTPTQSSKVLPQARKVLLWIHICTYGYMGRPSVHIPGNWCSHKRRIKTTQCLHPHEKIHHLSCFRRINWAVQ